MPIEAIFLDIDGTILTPSGVLRDDVAAAVRAAAQKTTVVLATGRRLGSAREIAHRLGLKTPILALNGALIVQADGSLLHRECLDARWTRMVMGRLSRLDAAVGLGLGSPDGVDLVGSERLGDLTRDYLRAARREDTESASYLVAFGARDPLQGVFRELLAAGAPFHGGVFEVDGERSELELFPIAASKGRGAAKMAHVLGLNPKNCIAVGDGDNDVDIISWAGLGVAMGNGDGTVKAVARRVIGHVSEGGLAEFLREIVGETERP